MWRMVIRVKGCVIHTLTDGNGMPLSNSTTAANGSEREQVMPLIDRNASQN
ncbi:hypothetical protein [Chlorogloea sp. CCALA 695]|uniref:hypothetical protein n=1 Tax=Chlorogloea sp. CCALA 695 TaxID=2107693 RepID=UPI0018EAF4FA|nr:hypothetical protein [Chlorogloea sp. CCALA 695]